MMFSSDIMYSMLTVNKSKLKTKETILALNNWLKKSET